MDLYLDCKMTKKCSLVEKQQYIIEIKFYASKQKNKICYRNIQQKFITEIIHCYKAS